jgi:hypothetical protein
MKVKLKYKQGEETHFHDNSTLFDFNLFTEVDEQNIDALSLKDNFDSNSGGCSNSFHG